MAEVRRLLAQKLGIPVSKGEDLTKGIAIEELIERESIGGTRMTDSHLTKRVLLLTEARQIAGGLSLREIKKESAVGLWR